MRRPGVETMMVIVIVIVTVALVATSPWAAAPDCRFAVAADAKTVKDLVTGLVWQRAVPAESYDWQGAKTYCQSLNALDFGGFSSGWRLPNIKELHLLMDPRAPPQGPTIDTDAFRSTPNSEYWSSSASALVPGHAWYVFFGTGFTGYQASANVLRVRCVH